MSPLPFPPGSAVGDRHDRAPTPPPLQHAVLPRPPSGFEAASHPELAVDVGQVELHRLVGDPEDLRHLAVRPSARDELQDLELATGQLAQDVRRPPAPSAAAGGAR